MHREFNDYGTPVHYSMVQPFEDVDTSTGLYKGNNSPPHEEPINGSMSPPDDLVFQYGFPFPHSPEVLNLDECGSGVMIPQPKYHPVKRLEPFAPEDPIFFSTNNYSKCGIPIKDALRRDFRNLDARDEEVLVHCNTSISLRFEWPGYPSWSKQIKTRNWKQPPSPILRAKLVKEIAKQLQAFIKDMKDLEPADARWALGSQIKAEELVLTSLVKVSKASWQPYFRLIYGRD